MTADRATARPDAAVIGAMPGFAPDFLPMQDSDLDAVMTIENDVYPFPWTAGNFRDALKAGYSGWVLRHGVDLVGYAIFMMAVDEAHLLNISVARPWQRQGLGARLLGQVMERARLAGATSLLLEVRPSNHGALALYETFGFARIGVRRGYYPAAVGREDAVVLRRELGEVLA